MDFDLRRAVVKNWPMKATSLAAAAVLWAVIAAQEPRTQYVPVNLTLQLPDGRGLAEAPPAVEALVTGPARELFKLYATPPSIDLTIPDDPATTYNLDLNRQNLRFGTDAAVAVQDIRPRHITVRLDSVLTKTVPVFSNATVVADTGFQLVGPPSITPASIVVTGTQTELAAISGLSTLPFTQTNARSTVRQPLALDTAGMSSVRLSQYGVTLVAVVVEITTRVLPNVRVTPPGEGGGRLTIEPATVLVTIRGPANRVERMTADSVSVTLSSSASS